MYITLKNIFKHYDEFKNNIALNNVTFKIEPQEKMVAIVGPSGAGKSTLINLIAALDQPDSGEIRVDSHNLTRLNRSQLANYRLHEIGIIFQFFNLFPTLTLFENIAVPGYLAKTSNKILHRKVEEIAEQVGISHLLTKHPHEISGGEAQRTAICRALINGPKILLADEPTGNLDTETAQVIFSLLQNLVEQQQLTVLVVTHDLSLINKVDKIINIKNGQVFL